ncbi:MAG TPA: hypothetical protein VN282_18785 [Pyrinomonadaceae bacterium]|nr:hypothetical protein [Pyrinomonadaceae bacterium]
MIKTSERTSRTLAFASLLLCLLLGSCAKEEPERTPAGWRARVTTLAGNGSPGPENGAALQSRFEDPFGVAVGADGTVYASDAGGSSVVRKLTPEGQVSTFAGLNAGLNAPSGLALDGEGNLYVADTGNNRVVKVSKEGAATALAGEGQFNGPVGVALDKEGNVYVADTYNDRVMLIAKDGQVRAVAGSGGPGHADGGALDAARFDTPCAVAVSAAGDIYVADTGNNRLRKITKDGQVSTLSLYDPTATAEPNTQGAPRTATQSPADAAAPQPSPTAPFELSKPAGLAVTRDGFLYVTELDRGRVVQVAPDGAAYVIAGRGGPGFADGEGRTEARFNQPAGVALAPDGSLVVADGANYLLRRVSPFEDREKKEGVVVAAAQTNVPRTDVLPRISVESLRAPFPWPLHPQEAWHELTATMGEARGSYDTDDSRHHLHSGVDVFGVYGQKVLAVRRERVTSPLANWGFGTLNEGFRAGLMTYVHLRVGRDEKDGVLNPNTFIPVRDAEGKVVRVRIRRGTMLSVGEELGTINRMYHVHMNLGPPGAELNPLALPFTGYSDGFAPRINRDGVQLFDESGARLTEKRAGRLVVRGRVRVVVDAFDQVDGNQPRRRLGLYKLGYQLLQPDGSPAPGFEQPRVQIEFDRLPPDREAPKIAYADESGITVYGSKETRFLYEVTNTVRQGRAERGTWDTTALPPGDYTLRILAADFAGNEATDNRDVPITVVP